MGVIRFGTIFLALCLVITSADESLVEGSVLRELRDLQEVVRHQGELLQLQNKQIEEQEGEIQTLKEQAHTQAYPLLVSLTDLTRPLPGETVITWDNVLINPDGAYDPSTGGYTAPVAGYFEFTVQLNVEFTDDATFFLTVNDVITTGTTEFDPDALYFSTATSSIVLQLQQGDVVKIQLGSDSTVWGVSETEGLFSWFSGFLLSASVQQ